MRRLIFMPAMDRPRATFSMDTMQMLDGNLGARAMRMVREWALLHADELRSNWRRAQVHEPLVPIAPLE